MTANFEQHEPPKRGGSSGSDSAAILHELLNNVAAISTFCSLVARDLDDAGPGVLQGVRDDVVEIRDAAKRASALGLQLADLLAGNADA